MTSEQAKEIIDKLNEKKMFFMTRGRLQSVESCEKDYYCDVGYKLAHETAIEIVKEVTGYE